jgi:hypothetical protein
MEEIMDKEEKPDFAQTDDFLKVWEDDKDRIFRFSEIEKHLEGISIKELFDAERNHSVNRLKDLRIVFDDVGQRVFITADNKAFSLLANDYKPGDREYDWWKEYSGLKFVDHPEWLPWIIQPIYRNGNEWGFTINEDLWKPRWIGTNDTDFDAIRFPLQTDFYEKHGFWVEGQDENDDDEYEYMMLYAELKIDERIAYVFGGNFANHVWFEGSKLPKGVRKVQLNREEPQTWLEFCNQYEDELFTDDFYVPVEPLPTISMTVNDPVLPTKKTRQMIQFPINLRRHDGIPPNDGGTVTVLWEGKDKFITNYTQT